jgi:cytoskeletal protein RodZ
MRKTSILALLTAVALTSPAFAQSSSEPASSEPSSQVSSQASSEPSSQPSSEASSSSSMSSEPSAEPAKDNWGSLISALQAGKSTTDLTTITDATVVNFVTVSSLKANGNDSALDNALDKNKAAVDELHTNVGGSAALTAKLTAAGYAAEDVIAVVTETDGSITVYIDDRA